MDRDISEEDAKKILDGMRASEFESKRLTQDILSERWKSAMDHPFSVEAGLCAYELRKMRTWLLSSRGLALKLSNMYGMNIALPCVDEMMNIPIDLFLPCGDYTISHGWDEQGRYRVTSWGDLCSDALTRETDEWFSLPGEIMDWLDRNTSVSRKKTWLR